MTATVTGGGLGTRPHRQPPGMMGGPEGKKDGMSWVQGGSQSWAAGAARSPVIPVSRDLSHSRSHLRLLPP